MHIPDNYLSPQTCAVMTAAMVPVWTVSVRRLGAGLGRSSGKNTEGVLLSETENADKVSRRRLTMLGAAAAFSFLGMMFNIPLPGGTTGHAVGGTLTAVLAGPYGACISISTALLLQALLFGDGGILAFGANCFNMAFVMPFVGYGLYLLIAGGHGQKAAKAAEKTAGTVSLRELVGIAAGSYAGINAAALCAAIEFGIQPLLFKDSAGMARYCPYPLSVSIPAMMAGHLTIFGLAEVVYTGAVFLFLAKTAPELLTGRVNHGPAGAAAAVETAEIQEKTGTPGRRKGCLGTRAVPVLLGLLMVLTPLGLLAEGTAWGEWGTDEIAAAGAGYTPAGMADGFSFEALLPDYSLGNAPAAVGYVLSALLGTAILLIVFRLLTMKKKKRSTACEGGKTEL